MLVAYVSGHGFGHATRTAEVLRQVRHLEPELAIAVVSSAPADIFRAAVAEGLLVRSEACDVGLVQRDALLIDNAATAERWREFRAGWDDRVQSEAEWLAGEGARIVLGDVPPLAFEAAFRASVPSLALANFSWDWIYRHLGREEPMLQGAAEVAAAAYGHAGGLLRLPFHGDLSAFRHVEDIPLVARWPRQERKASREVLGFGERPVVVVSFGGLGLPGFDPAVLGALPDYDFVLPEAAAAPANVRALSWSDLADRGLGYPDLLAAADAVVTKPGYGIVTDCIAARTPIVYTDRGDFPEYPILVEGLVRYLPCAYVDNAAIRRGDLGEALASVMGRRVPPAPPLDGARVAAERLVESARRSPRDRPRAALGEAVPPAGEHGAPRRRHHRVRRNRRSPLTRWLQSTGLPVRSGMEAVGVLIILALLTAALALGSLVMLDRRATARRPASPAGGGSPR